MRFEASRSTSTRRVTPMQGSRAKTKLNSTTPPTSALLTVNARCGAVKLVQRRDAQLVVQRRLDTPELGELLLTQLEPLDRAHVQVLLDRFERGAPQLEQALVAPVAVA